MEFDILGIDVSIANALRRIIISEIPTMAIEKVDIYMNTSVIPDEILAHRLGLIPIIADPKLFSEKIQDEEYNENNTIKFKLHKKCVRKQQYKLISQIELDNYKPEEYLENVNIYASDFEWIPIGNQANNLTYAQVKPIHDKVLIAKLRENQEIELEVFCEKNIGKVHAKWSPVAPAFYRLMPKVKINKNIQDEQEMINLLNKCPVNVFAIQNNKKNKSKQLIVKNPRNCTMCRECIRQDDDLQGNNENINNENQQTVFLGKEVDHFIFTIEAVGMISPQNIFLQAIQILKNKINSYLTNFNNNIYI